MADTKARLRSLRRRFAVSFGLIILAGAVAIRVLHYRATVALLSRDVDVQVWSRLGAIKARERFTPGNPLGSHPAPEELFLPDLRAAAGASADGPPFRWFAGVWRTDGTAEETFRLPPEVRWDPVWAGKLDRIWTTPDGRHRLAATAGSHDTLILVGSDLADLAASERETVVFHVWTFLAWVPALLGIAWLLLSRLLRPLDAIADTARRIREGHFEERIDVSNADAEIAGMAGTINEMLDRLDSIRLAQSRFNADVAHQIMNPVHAIQLEADLAASQPRTADELAESLARVRDLGGRVASVCEALLAYAQSAALDPASLRPVDLEAIVDAAIEQVAPRAAARDVEIVASPVEAVVRGSSDLLQEVFVNLLSNAVEHAPEGSKVEVVAETQSGECRVRVVDHGRGVSPPDEPHIFERFYRGATKPDQHGGHGVGLSLCRTILRSHSGDVSHRPTPGGGATFEVRLPAAGRDRESRLNAS